MARVLFVKCVWAGREDHAKDRLLRACSLVCMMPKEKTPPEVIEQRKVAVAKGISTTSPMFSPRPKDSVPTDDPSRGAIEDQPASRGRPSPGVSEGYTN